jgi:hypothetical protein
VSDRWVPDSAPGDGPAGRGESGPPDELDSRQVTEEAAMTGRFPDGDEVRDDSNPIEPEGDDAGRESYPIELEQPGIVSGGRAPHSHGTNPGQSGGEFDRGVATEHLRSASQGARPERVDRTMEPPEEG